MPGIYIHIPFCKQACFYCDFHFSTNLKKKDAMLSAICRELEIRKTELADKVVETIYFGGGTPSLLRPREISRILGAIEKHYKTIEEPEITLEANPDDLDKQKIAELESAGINRLSIGIQSFSDPDLELMNRAHNSRQAMECLEEARRTFENISIDLIYGIPGLTDSQWQTNIDLAREYDVPHISSYALTVEPNTALQKLIEKGRIPDVDESQAEAQFQQLKEILEQDGFVHYELSNFGRPGFFSKNNTAYWKGKSYMGIGPSAHSFTGDKRGWNIRNNTKYIRALEGWELPLEWEVLSKKDRYNETVMMGLRTMWGISLEQIRTVFGSQYEEYLLKQGASHLEAHRIYMDDDTLFTSKKALFLADGIASDLFMLNLEKT